MMHLCLGSRVDSWVGALLIVDLDLQWHEDFAPALPVSPQKLALSRAPALSRVGKLEVICVQLQHVS